MTTIFLAGAWVGFCAGVVLASWYHGHKRAEVEVDHALTQIELKDAEEALDKARVEAAEVVWLRRANHRHRADKDLYKEMAAQNARFLKRAERERDEARAMGAGAGTVGDEAEAFAHLHHDQEGPG